MLAELEPLPQSPCALKASTLLTVDGETRSAWAWSVRLGVPVRTILGRLARGWPVAEACTALPGRFKLQRRDSVPRATRGNSAECELFLVPTEAEILSQAKRIRETRERETQHYIGGLVPQEYAAAVLGLHAQALRTWSRFWQRRPAEPADYKSMLGQAILAHEWVEDDAAHLLSFRGCCDLLAADPDEVRSKLFAECDPSALLWLAIVRGLEQIVTGELPAAERVSLSVPEPIQCGAERRTAQRPGGAECRVPFSHF